MSFICVNLWFPISGFIAGPIKLCAPVPLCAKKGTKLPYFFNTPLAFDRKETMRNDRGEQIDSEPVEKTPPRRLGAFFLFFFIAMIGGALDLATKRLIFDQLGLPGEKPIDWVIPNLFGFQTSLNEGALFGMGSGMALFFAAASVVALLAILLWLWVEAYRSRLLTFALGLISAGIFGNLWDRLALHGILGPDGEPLKAVRDWILVLIGSYHWPNFNLADSFLVAGTFLVLFFALRAPRSRSESTSPDGEGANN